MNSTAILTDASGEVGKLYSAKTTPHMFVIDEKHIIQYQGAFDDHPDAFDAPEDARNYVRAALAEVKAGKPVSIPETQSYGCSVKYK